MKVGVVGLGLIGGSIFKGMDGKHDGWSFSFCFGSRSK